MAILVKLLHKPETEGTLSDPLYKATITLTPKPHKELPPIITIIIYMSTATTDQSPL